MEYFVTVKNQNGKTETFSTATLPEAKPGAFQETLEAGKHYYFILPSGDHVEYRTADAAKPSVFSEVAPTPVPVPPTPAPPTLGQMFDPNSFLNKPLPAAAKLRGDSASLVAYLVKASYTKDQGGAAVYYPNIALNEYTVPIFEVTDPSIPKSKITVQDMGNPTPKSFTEIHKQLQSEGFRLPANLAGSEGGDGSGVVWDKTDDSMLEFWQYRVEGGVPKISWGAVLKNVSKHPGFIATLPNGEKQGSRASGICLAGGVGLFKDAVKGRFPYALGLALPNCANAQSAGTPNCWLAPAQRTDGADGNPSVVKMGTLFRLPASYVVPPGTAPIVKMIIEAVRDFGCYIVDTTGGNNMGFQVEDIGHLAPAGTPDVNAWAWDQYKALWAGRQSWDLMRLVSKGGQFPWDLMQAVEFPIS